MSKQIIRRSLPKQIQDKIDKKSSRSPNEQRRNLQQTPEVIRQKEIVAAVESNSNIDPKTDIYEHFNVDGPHGHRSVSNSGSRGIRSGSKNSVQMVSPSPDLPKKKTKRKKKSPGPKVVTSARFPRGRSAQEDFGYHSVSEGMNPKHLNSSMIQVSPHRKGGYAVKRLCHGSIFGN